MGAGVAAHLVLHWNWMVCMTRKLLSSNKTKQSGIPELKPACGIIGE